MLPLLLACALTPAPQGNDVKTEAPAAPSDILPFHAVEKTLDNGLRVIVVPTGFPNLVSLQIPVQTGSRNEVEPGKTGFAHFFEHMMFRGTKRYPPHEYEEVITKAGARQNAYTTDDYTNYHVTFAKESLEKVLEIEADRFMHLDYSEEGFRTEALAVLGEYNKNSANPFNKLHEVMRERAFTTHTYKHTTMGFLSDIEAMPSQLEYSRTFFDRWYRPEHTTILLAGDVAPSAAIPLVERYFGAWKRGSHRAEIPPEPPPQGPLVAHVPWPVPTLPWVTASFHGPAFSESEPDSAALDLLLQLHFGETSALYEKLVVDEQKLDELFYGNAEDQDPSLAGVYALLKEAGDALYVRDQILRTIQTARSGPVSARRLEEAKSNLRYAFARTLDNSETIASVLARFVRFRRSYDTLNNLFRLYERVTPEDLLAAAQTYLTDERLVLTTLSHEALAEEVPQVPALASFEVTPAAAAAEAEAVAEPAPAAAPSEEDAARGKKLPVVLQKTPNPQLTIKIAFEVGSTNDPADRPGLASLAAAMIAEGGSQRMEYDRIQKALFPVAGGFSAQVDREQTVFTGQIHRDNAARWLSVALEQLTQPGFRAEDFTRVREQQRNALVQDLRTNNDEELGKEVLQARIFAGTKYGHPTLGTVAALDALGVADVKIFAIRNYTLSRAVVGVAGDAPEGFVAALRAELGRLRWGDDPLRIQAASGRAARGIEVEIVRKKTRSTAISLGFPIEVTRPHPDFAALYLARTWLGEHRSSMSHLYQRIREARGMNYGDYAYIEAFPGGMFQFFPDPNRARRAQIFEIWIRPVPPEQAHHALRIAIHELEKLVRTGLSAEEFESTRQYLMKNVFLMTATQDQQIGYALDSRFYGTEEYTAFMRARLARLTAEEVNKAIRKHLQAQNLHVVCVADDADGLRARLLADEPSAVAYAAEKPAELLEEDARIGARKLGIKPESVRIVPVEDVFAR